MLQRSALFRHHKKEQFLTCQIEHHNSSVTLRLQSCRCNTSKKLKKTHSMDAGTGVYLPSESGTGVFLPKSQSLEDNTESTTAETPCSESDGDSNESASDCINLEERRPPKKGLQSLPLPHLIGHRFEKSRSTKHELRFSFAENEISDPALQVYSL